jgi:hypothetical protein
LHTDDCTHSLVTTDAEHAEDLLIKLHARHHIVQHGEELVFVVGMLVDVFKVLQDLREVFGRLRQVLHRAIDACLRRVRHQDANVFLEVVLKDVG